MHNNSILVLTLQVFSATGGIEKVCKVVGKSLDELSDEPGGASLKVFSMYDNDNDVDEKYIPVNKFRGFGKHKIAFVKGAVLEGRKSGTVILSHINLLLVGFLIKVLSPKTKLILFAHGIEVWGPLSRFRKYMLHKCDLILAVSNFTKNKMKECYHLPEEKLKVINNCLDPFLPPPVNASKNISLLKKYGINDTDFVLMTLTRLSSKEKYKGYDHVLYAIEQLKNKYPGIKYLIVGKYDDKEKARLDTIIKEFSLEAQIIFAGYVPDADLANYYNLADLYVMPSKKEGFGIVFIEALFYGLPVIAGNKDGSVDALCNGELGSLVDPDSQEEINAAIEKVIQSKQILTPAHNLLLNKFSFQNYKNDLQKIINGL